MYIVVRHPEGSIIHIAAQVTGTYMEHSLP